MNRFRSSPFEEAAASSSASPVRGRDAAPSTAAESSSARTEAEILERIKRLPPTVGATLVAAGVVALVVPGAAGAPLLLAGGMALAPKLFADADRYAQQNAPHLRKAGLRMLDRFLSDLERRYPSRFPS